MARRPTGGAAGVGRVAAQARGLVAHSSGSGAEAGGGPSCGDPYPAPGAAPGLGGSSGEQPGQVRGAGVGAGCPGRVKAFQAEISQQKAGSASELKFKC